VTFDFVNKVVHGSGEDQCINCEQGDGTDAGDDTFLDDPAKCNTFNGNGKDDVFHAVNRPGTEQGGTCGDTVNGGNGRDTYDARDVPANSPGVTFDFVNKVVHGSGTDTCDDCENGWGTLHGDDVFLDEDNSCNGFLGGGGDDIFVAGLQRPGGESDPEFTGTCGDNVDLGEGDETTGDLLDYSRTTGPDGVIMDIPQGTVTDAANNAEIDTGAFAENLTGTNYNDTLIGSSEDNVIKGMGGDDTIITNGGNDDVDGGTGVDTVDGQPEEGIYCNLQTGIMVVDGQTTTGVTSCTGTTGDDTLIGNSASNVIHGGGGNDHIEGGGGSDQLFGDEGDDDIDGGADNDTIRGGAGEDTIRGGIGNDTIYGGDDDDVINGNDGNDTMYGENGNDTLSGDGGNDIIRGGAGNDGLDGGPGTDNLDGGTEIDACTTGETTTNCE
jgi:Ca2+-binding RTX toxin-like protein